MKCTSQAEKLLMRATALKITNAAADAQSLLFHALAKCTKKAPKHQICI